MPPNLTPKQLLDQLGVPYRERVNRLQLCCPFHGDTNPSAGFYFSTGLFFCYACELTLDVVGFYAKFKSMPRERADVELVTIYGGVVEERSSDPLQIARVRYNGELLLAERKDLPRKEHAALAEKLDKILYAFEHKLITDNQLDGAVSRLYIKIGQDLQEGADID